MERIEFYTYDDEVWCRYEDGRNERLTEKSTEIVDLIFDLVMERYSEAFAAMEVLYGKSKPNLPYYKYVVVRRFIKCNFSKMDGTYIDFDSFAGNNIFNPEKVECPIRGECPFEGTICMPIFSSKLTERQSKIAKMLYEGYTKDQIAESLFLSWETVNCHVSNIYRKLGVHSEAEFVRFVIANKIF